MACRKEKGIYRFLEKNYPPKSKKSQRNCLDLLNSRCHYFVVTRVGVDSCDGFMLTHGKTEDYPDNMALKPEHFVEGEGLLPFDNSYFLRVPLIKANNLSTEEVGLFTDEGRDYLLANALGHPCMWHEYIEKHCDGK
jgi:hypothetical protein